MASFKEVDKGKYKLYVELGYRGKRRIRKTKTVYVKNKTEAKKELVKFEAELMDKKIIENDNMTVNEFYPKWKDKYAKLHYGYRAFASNCKIIEKRILPEFGDIKMKDIKKLDIVTFMDDISKDGKRLDGKEGKLSPATIYNIHKAFNRLMDVAEDWELIESNPCQKVKLPKVSSEKTEVYSVEETSKLFNKLESYSFEWQLIVKLAAISGARQGEIVALEEKHLNKKDNSILFEQAIVYVPSDGLKLKETKTERSRKVSIPKNLMDDLMKLKLIKQTELMEVQNMRVWSNHTFLFSNEFGKPLRPDSVSQQWIRFLKQNNDLKKIRFHDLRHTSATLLINDGVHAKVIQERLGHTDIGTTMNTYGHVLEEAEQESAKHFDKFFNSK